MLKSKLFTRYVTSYTVLFFIPLLILAVYAFNNFNDVLKKEVNQNNSRLLEQSKNAIDSRVEEMIKLSIQISNNPYFSSTRLNDNDSFINVVQAIKLLENFSIPNNFYNNFFIYYFDRDLIYSPQGTLQPSYFSNSIYKYDNWDIEQLEEQLKANPKNFVRPAETVYLNSGIEKYMTFISPLPYSSEQPTGAMFFVIRESAIHNMLSETLNANKSSILILDPDFTPITMLGSLKQDKIDLAKLQQEGTQFAVKTTVDSSSYYRSSITSDRTGWTYVSYMPTDSIAGKLANLKLMTVGLVLFLFAFGILLIYFFMRMNYKPLDELTTFVARITGSASSAKSGGIESVHSAVHQMSKQINVLEKKMESAAYAMRYQLLQQLLKGAFTDLEEFNLKGAEYSLTVSGSHYAVVIIMFDSIRGVNEEQITAVLDHAFEQTYHYFVIEDVQDDQLILILSDENGRLAQCEELCSQVLKSFKSDFGIYCTIGVGEWHASLSDISRSYLQACSAIDYWPIRGKHAVIAYQEMEESKDYIAHYPHQQVELLKEYIAQRDTAKFASLMDSIIKSIQEKNIPLITARLLFYNLIQAIIRALYRNNYELSDEIKQNLNIISLEIGRAHV